MNLRQKSHFFKLFHGTQQLVRELCREGPFQNGKNSLKNNFDSYIQLTNFIISEFLKHSPCLGTVNDDKCASNYHEVLTKSQGFSLENEVNNHTSSLVCW